MSRGGCNPSPRSCSTSTPPRSETLLAQALNPYTQGSDVVTIATSRPGDRAHSADDDGDAEGEVVALPPLTSTNDEECSGGETRTLNLAVNSRLLCH